MWLMPPRYIRWGWGLRVFVLNFDDGDRGRSVIARRKCVYNIHKYQEHGYLVFDAKPTINVSHVCFDRSMFYLEAICHFLVVKALADEPGDLKFPVAHAI
jgi:hypothetical protein